MYITSCDTPRGAIIFCKVSERGPHPINSSSDYTYNLYLNVEMRLSTKVKC